MPTSTVTGCVLKSAHQKGAGKAQSEYQLYNLASDLGEKKNLAASNPKKLAEMKEILQRLLKDAVPSGNNKTP